MENVEISRSSVDELEKLNGIGPRQVQELRPFLKVDGDTEKR